MPGTMFMEKNGLKCQVNLPDAPEGEGTHQLPPYNRQRVYDVDQYPACPAEWMHGSDKAGSFFFPVETGKHLWLDLNPNASHRHHIAAVISVQGVNPITGPIEGLDGKKLDMIQWKDGDPCPVHPDRKFDGGLYCKDCKFKWPSQNYLCTTSWPSGQFWIDGWRATEETIRGFLITMETMKGIAAQTIGEDRVWAIGIAIYLSKEEKPQPVRHDTLRSSEPISYTDQLMDYAGGYETSKSYSFNAGETLSRGMSSSVPPTASTSGRKRMRSVRTRGGISGQSVRSAEPVEQIEAEKLEIAAGAKITQQLCYPDTHDLDFWQDKPAAILYGNYCTVEDFDRIIRAGTRDLTAGGEGFMAGLETGNP